MTDTAEYGRYAGLGPVLVANRGEIAVRIMRTLRRLNLRSVAVFSDADAGAPHVVAADDAIRLGPAPAAESYLSVDRILAAACTSGARAIHPGYGFLSENASFAAAVHDAGLVFLGPPAAAIEAMGDKVRAKRTAEAAGVPVVPGRHESGMSDEDLIEAAAEIGYPVLLKPSAGGGGKGMRSVFEPDRLAAEIASARREARASFGDDTLLVERLVSKPRHVEIQVMADQHGNVLHLGERECSLQRRHQKIIEESPSPLLTATVREKMGAAAVEAARAVGYVGAGTVEFIMSDHAPDEFFFMEMNTRLQVEHPVTELVTGLDLVELQVLVAAGERLPLEQSDVRLSGHAIEARVYAEDAANGFLPTGGTVLRLREPADVRMDSGLAVGSVVGSDYDPMLAKVIAAGPDRATALARLVRALGETTVLGVGTNLDFLRGLLTMPEVVDGRLDTELVDRSVAGLAAVDVPVEALAAVGVLGLLRLEPVGGVVQDAFDRPGGWRVGEPAWTRWQVVTAGFGPRIEPVEVRARGRAAAAEIALDAGSAVEASGRWLVPGERMLVAYAGRIRTYEVAVADDIIWLAGDDGCWALREESPLSADRAGDSAAASGTLTAPMPGTVTIVSAVEGQQVSRGDQLVVVEAMKMEHALVAPFDGTVTELRADPGQPVAIGAPLVTVTPESSEAPPN